MLQRFADWWKQRAATTAPAAESTTAAEARQVDAARALMRNRPLLEHTVRIDEVTDAAIAAELFRRKFGQEVPTFPRHFVAMIGEQCAGYVHYSAWQGDYLCGGLCIDDRAFRGLSPLQRAWVRERGGIAEIMLRAAHAALTDGATIWGYIGDKQAEAVDRRVGFEKVAEPYLFAIWRKPISDEGKRRRVAEAEKLGAF